MIVVDNDKQSKAVVKFVSKGDESLPVQVKPIFDGTFLTEFHLFVDDVLTVYVGLGEEKELTLHRIKEAAAKAAKTMKQLKQAEYTLDALAAIQEYGIDCVFELTSGLKLGLYQYAGHYQKQPEQYVCTVYLKGFCSQHKEEIQEKVNLAEHVCDGIMMARDWVNMPGNLLTPEMMANKIVEKGKAAGCKTQVLSEADAAKLGMNCFLTVGKSSSNSAKLVVLRYMGDPGSKEITALIGKGVTCDTGGYCLKTRAGLENTKGDMGGAAAVTAAICALAQNKVKSNVIAVVPACENRLSNDSAIPGDVVTSMNGKTVEILNTDAEGRLILADAMTYAIRKEHATRVIDVATLTGAIANAFGSITAGLMTNDKAFSEEFFQAADIAGEKYWLLPTDQEYKEMLKGRVADLVNTARFGCGSIVAGLFVGEFCEDLPWIHLDIAGTAWVDKPNYEYQAAGATGAAAASMYFLLER